MEMEKDILNLQKDSDSALILIFVLVTVLTLRHFPLFLTFYRW